MLMVKKSKNIVAILNYIFAHASTEVCARQFLKITRSISNHAASQTSTCIYLFPF